MGFVDEEPHNPTVPSTSECFHIPTVMSGFIHATTIVMAAKPEPLHVMAAKPEPLHVLAAKPEPLHVGWRHWLKQLQSLQKL